MVRDAQGIRGKKIEIYSLPYSAINVWSSENARGLLDFNGEIELWTRAGHITVNLAKGIDVRRLDKPLIANAVLGNRRSVDVSRPRPAVTCCRRGEVSSADGASRGRSW